jgi:hypothetical protein
MNPVDRYWRNLLFVLDVALRRIDLSVWFPWNEGRNIKSALARRRHPMTRSKAGAL